MVFEMQQRLEVVMPTFGPWTLDGVKWLRTPENGRLMGDFLCILRETCRLSLVSDSKPPIFH